MCCGRSKRVANQPAAVPASFERGPLFEYVGRTALTVVGPVTGARYRFDRPGARAHVHSGDGKAMAGVPALRAVS